MRVILICAVMIAASDARQLRITVYDKAQLPPQVSASVSNELSRIFHQSGISVEWVAGLPTASEASLMIYGPSSSAREQETVCRARRDIALDILSVAPPGLKGVVLGMAQPLARTGLNVRVFYDHVRKASEKQNRPLDSVLTHVIAHEVGHVLLRSFEHDRRGLMSETWSSAEYEWMAKGLLFFTAGESRRMRMTLSGAKCPTTVD
jgi:hypothetical protein